MLIPTCQQREIKKLQNDVKVKTDKRESADSKRGWGGGGALEKALSIKIKLSYPRKHFASFDRV